MIEFFELQRFPLSFLIRIKGQPEKSVVFSTGTNSQHSDKQIASKRTLARRYFSSCPLQSDNL